MKNSFSEAMDVTWESKDGKGFKEWEDVSDIPEDLSACAERPEKRPISIVRFLKSNRK